jgi:ribosomal protein S18 acetylase RimI-like enzyme
VDGSVAIVIVGVDGVDDLRELWLSLHRHHREVAAIQPLVADDEASWQRRRATYVEELRAGRAFALVAREAEERRTEPAADGADPRTKPAADAADPGTESAASGADPPRESAALGYAFVVLHPGPDDTFPFGDQHGELYTLAVTPRARGRGVGTALMDAVDAELERRGIADLEIAVMAGNDRALRFYERRGLVAGEIVLYRLGRPAAP